MQQYNTEQKKKIVKIISKTKSKLLVKQKIKKHRR